MGANRRDRRDGRRHGLHEGRAQDRSDRCGRDCARIGLCARGSEGVARGVAPRPVCAGFPYPRDLCDELIAKKPETVERFLRAWFETIAFMRANKERTVEITAKVLNLDKAVIARVYDEQIKIFTSDGRFDPKALVVIRQSLVEMGILQQVPNDDVMFTTRFLPVKY